MNDESLAPVKPRIVQCERGWIMGHYHRPMTGNMDVFAEMLSRYGCAERSAGAMGRSKRWGETMLKRIRDRLGEQAQ